MEHVHPILIIGLGIAGTLLSFELYKNKIPFVVINNVDISTASWSSGAVLNPYSGKTIKGLNRRTIMYQKAENTYQAIGKLLNKTYIKKTPLLKFEPEAIDVYENVELFNSFKNDTKASIFKEVSTIQNIELLKDWTTFLLLNNLLIEENFEEKDLNINAHFICYKNIQYSKIIFCTGANYESSKLFTGLKFTQNRGDYLEISIPQLNPNFIYQLDKTRLLPKSDGVFWCGSNYIWQYDNMQPNLEWYNLTSTLLHQWLNIPFTVIAHKCAKRPTTAGQIPFIGWHPQFSNIGICNGLGTKGFSAGPMWINDFVEQSILSNSASQYQYIINKQLL